MNNNKLKSLLNSTRPKTLLVGISPVILGAASAYSSNQLTFNWPIFLLTITCTLLLQAGTNIVNEYFDFITGVDTLERVGPKRSLLSGEIGPKVLRNFYLACFALSFLIGTYLIAHGGTQVAIIGLTSIAIAYCYTGGPLPLSHYCLGELLAFLFFGPVAVIGTVILQNGLIDKNLILVSAIPGFISAALMSLNNLRDIKTDATTNKKTIAILIGEKNARYFTISLGVMPLIICFFIDYTDHLWRFFLILPPLFFIPLWKLILKNKEMADLNTGIANFGKYNVLYCLILSISFLFK